MRKLEKQLSSLLQSDPYLEPYSNKITERLAKIEFTEQRLTQGKISLADFGSGHEYFGLHFINGEWFFREWAPNATAIYLIGELSKWEEREEFALKKISGDGVWEIRIAADKLHHGALYRLRIHWSGGRGDRIPAYSRRVVQDPNTLIFNSQVWAPPTPYRWKYPHFKRSNEEPFIYEAHIGMAQEEEKIGSFQEFTNKVLPRIINAGYNTLQLMAIQEHPYYGSFGTKYRAFLLRRRVSGHQMILKNLLTLRMKQG